MTQNASKLIDLKLAVIKWHDGDNMDYLHKGIARDACYTSYNSLSFKKKQIADSIADFESAIAENRDTLAERLCTRIEHMEVELEELNERHEADRAVFHIITDGEEWTPNKSTRSVSGDLAKRVAQIKKVVA